MLHIYAAVAEKDRCMIAERTKHVLSATKARLDRKILRATTTED